jgi:membrane dipeptidase
MTVVHPVIDGHNDLPWQLRIRDADFDLRADLSATGLHTDLTRLERGGVAGQFWSVYVPSGVSEPESVATVLEQIDLVKRLAARYPDRLALAGTAEEAERARADGRVESLLGDEGGHSINSSLGVLRML